MAQEERRRQAALEEEQAYLEELERRRQMRLYEEEMERRRQECLYGQAMEERIRQNQRLYEEEMERRRRRLFAAAYDERKLKIQQQKQKEEEEATRVRREAVRRTSPRYQLVCGPDGCLYRILMNPSDECNCNHEDRGTCLDATYEPSAAPIFEEESPSSASSMVTSVPSVSAEKKDAPVFKNVTFNISINHGDEKEDFIDNTSKPTKAKKRSSKKKEKKSSLKSCHIVIGEVEDASDSECEDEFGDYFHNRRPTTPGMWIEPVEGLNARII